jgi:tetratricopeptide (TPR) repeat protein
MELNVLYHAPSATFPFIGEDGTNPMQQKSAGMHDLTCDLYPAAPSLNFNCAYFFAVVEPEDEIELWRLYPDLHLEDNEFSIVRSQGSDIVAFDDDDNGMSVDQRKEFNHILDLTSVFHDARAHMDRDSQIAACLDIWSLAIRKYNTCDWKEVSELQVRVVEWLPLLVPPNHQWLVSSVGLLASACGEQGRLIEAEWHHVEQTNRSRAIHGAAHLATLSSEHGLALLYMHTGRLENAHTLAQSSYEGQKAILGDTHVDTIYSMMTLGGIYLRSRQYAAAKRILLQVIKAFTTQLGRNHIFTFRACQELGSIFLNAGYPDVACRLWQKVVDRMQMTFEYDHDDLMAAMAGLARAHIKTLNFAAAKELLLIVSAIWQRKYGDGAAIQQEVLLDLATACDGLGQQEDALRYQRRAVIANGDQTHNRLNLLSRYHEGVKRLLGAGCVQEAIALETLANRVARLLDLR